MKPRKLALLAILSLLSLSLSRPSNAGIILHGDDAVVQRCILYTTHLCVSGTGDSLKNLTTVDVIFEGDETCTAVNCILDSVNVASGKTVTGVTNLVRSAAKGGDGTYTDTGTVFSGNVTLIDADNGNYRVAAGSPAINAGTDVGLTTDYAGQQWMSWDIGAYRYTWLQNVDPWVSPWRLNGQWTGRKVWTSRLPWGR